VARIALDIDSTLHHYWDLIDRVSRERFGVELPYGRQTSWGIKQLDREQVVACVEETHSDENILAAEPYPGAAEAVRAWRQAGHWIQVTSHRSQRARRATARWLERIGLPYDDLHCSYDKIARCRELGVQVLIDDSPVNLYRARKGGMLAATILHPWNEAIVERGEGVVGAVDWPSLSRLLEPLLARIERRDGERRAAAVAARRRP
jgi:uncharacterized protein